MPQYVKLVNKGDTPFDFHHHNKKRVLKPGAEAAVPWDLACTLFGDPYTLDDGKRNDRTRVSKQVRGNFGYQSGMMTEDEWNAIRPNVETYDLETGERIYMLLEDPDGLYSLPNDEEVDQSDQVALLQRQIAQLSAAVATLTTARQEQETEEAIGVSASVGKAEGQVNATSTDSPNPEAPQFYEGKDNLNVPSLHETPPYTLTIPQEEQPVKEDTPHTPTLPPRPKK